MSSIGDTFERLKQNNKSAFIPYLTYGYPNRAVFKQLVVTAVAAGADMLEIGMPFSDPIADGPVICAASYSALKNGAALTNLLSDLAELKKKVNVPFLLMSYLNPIYYAGIDKFCRGASRIIDGLVIPDLLPEEGKNLIDAAKKNNIATVFFIAVTTDVKRYAMIDKASSGFIYLVSVTGTTGVKKKFDSEIFKVISAVKHVVRMPVVVGFGIGTPKQVRQFGRSADGVIVGSAIIKFISEYYRESDFPAKFKKFIEYLKGK